jgi:hypothetical protein
MFMAARKDITIIRARIKTRDRLKKFGTKGDTYDDIIWELMDKVEKYEKQKR